MDVKSDHSFTCGGDVDVFKKRWDVALHFRRQQRKCDHWVTNCVVQSNSCLKGPC